MTKSSFYSRSGFDYSSVLTSAPPPVNTVRPAITGTAAVGATLTAIPGTWTGAATVVLSWQSNGVTLVGATSTTLLLTHALAGTVITATETATNTGGTGTATSTATAAVTEPPSNITIPVVSGITHVSSTLSVTNGTWNGFPAPVAFSYQWLDNGVAIPFAATSTYSPVTGDLGNNISCTVTATNSTGSASQTSVSVGPITSGGGYTPALKYNDQRNSMYEGAMLS